MDDTTFQRDIQATFLLDIIFDFKEIDAEVHQLNKTVTT